MDDDEFNIDDLKRVLDEFADGMIDRVFRRMIIDACVAFGANRVLDAVLAVMFMRAAGIAAADSQRLPVWLDAYDYTDGVLDPVAYNGLPMVMKWDYFGSELFEDGVWSTRNWFRLVGVPYQSPEP